MDHESEIISGVLRNSRTIAIVGLSTNPARDSHEVADYLQRHGYRIVPVNPTYAGQEILGEKCYSNLVEAAAALKKNGNDIDVVDCFRKSEAIEPIAEDAIKVGVRCLWMQLGVENEAAAVKAREAGIEVVMDRCLKIEHMHADRE